MGSSNSEPPSAESLSIPKLRETIESSFRAYENQEKNMKDELNKLMVDRDSLKEQVVSLEKTRALMRLDQLKLEEELQRHEKECEKLNEKNMRLMEEQKERKELYEKALEENSKMTDERSKLISENETTEKKIMEIEQQLGVYEEKLESFDRRFEQMEVEKSNLEKGLHTSEMKCEEQEMIIAGLKCEKDKLITENKRLKQKNWEIEQKFLFLDERVVKLEQEIQDLVHTAYQRENQFGGGCEGQKGSATESKRKKSSVLHGGDEMRCSDSGGVVVRGNSVSGTICCIKVASSSSASKDVIQVSESDNETRLCEKHGTVSCISLSNQKSKRVRMGQRGDSLMNLISKRGRSAAVNLPTDEKESESLESTDDRTDRLEKDLSRKPVSGLSPATLPSMRCVEKDTAACDFRTPPLQKQRFMGLIDEDSTDLED